MGQDAPYPPSGWKPSGPAFNLPPRQVNENPNLSQTNSVQTQYGSPSLTHLPDQYGPPPKQNDNGQDFVGIEPRTRRPFEGTQSDQELPSQFRPAFRTNGNDFAPDISQQLPNEYLPPNGFNTKSVPNFSQNEFPQNVLPLNQLALDNKYSDVSSTRDQEQRAFDSGNQYEIETLSGQFQVNRKNLDKSGTRKLANNDQGYKTIVLTKEEEENINRQYGVPLTTSTDSPDLTFGRRNRIPKSKRPTTTSIPEDSTEGNREVSFILVLVCLKSLLNVLKLKDVQKHNEINVEVGYYLERRVINQSIY